MGKKDNQNKPKLSPEEIAQRKAEAAARKALADVQPALARIAIALTDKMPHCSFIIPNNKKTPNIGIDSETMVKHLELITSAGSSDKRLNGIDDLVLLMMSKTFLDDDNILEVGLYVPNAHNEKININTLMATIIEDFNCPTDGITANTAKGVIMSSSLHVESPEKVSDQILITFMTTLKKTSVYVEEESDDEDMGDLANAAGIEW
jgi:hypothetical protein